MDYCRTVYDIACRLYNKICCTNCNYPTSCKMEVYSSAIVIIFVFCFMAFVCVLNIFLIVVLEVII